MKDDAPIDASGAHDLNGAPERALDAEQTEPSYASSGNAVPEAGTPTAADAAALDWRALTVQGRYKAARNAYLVSGEQDPEVRAGLGALVDVQELLRERSYSRALERLERLDVHADFAPWDQLADELKVLKDTAGALDRRDPDLARELLSELHNPWFSAEVMTLLGTTEVYDNNMAEAAALLERAIEVDPQHYRALTNLGNLALEDGRVDEAIDLYERALKIDENFPNAHHNLGVAYRKKGQLNKSVRSLRRAQRTQQRHEVAEARESIGKWAGPNFGKYMKWIVWGAVIVAGYFLLRAAGYI